MPDRERISELFDAIAPQYDHLNHLMSFNLDRSWRRKAVRRIVLDETPLRILDVATGTGDLAIDIACKAKEGSKIVGLDLSEKMLAIARQKVEREDLSQIIDLQQGSCEQLPFADSSFDRVSVAFGVRNFENMELGLHEMCRVLRPGGSLVILELSYPDSRFLQWCFRQYALHWLPLMGGKVSGHRAAYEYLPNSILKFPKPAVLIPKLREAGFDSVDTHAFTFGICRMYVAEKAK